MQTLILNPDFDVIIFRRESGSTSPVDENTLPITPELKAELLTYYRAFSELYILGSGKATDLENRLLDADGFKLWLQLRQQLSPQYEVTFYSHFFRRIRRSSTVPGYRSPPVLTPAKNLLVRVLSHLNSRS